MFVDGRWTTSLSGETFTADSPATGEQIGEVPQGDRDDAQLAIAAANRAAEGWANATAFERAGAMVRVAEAIEARFTRDLAKGLRFAESVRTGWVNINESSNYWESHLPFGGRSGTASGIGRVGGTAPMEAFTELQTVVLS